MRATSTVVDVTVFLLLVSGAVGALVAGTGATAPQSGEPAAETARVLATSTATVTYPIATRDVDADALPGGERRVAAASERTTHGTLAALLADATVANATVGGERLSPAATGYRTAVAGAVENGTGRVGRHTAVRATWRPYPGAPVGGSASVGPAPPADADVHAATIRVGSGIAAPPSGSDAPDSFRGLAESLSRAVVRRFFDPNATRLAVRGSYPSPTLTEARYARAERALGVDGRAGRDESVQDRNDRLAGALADRLAPDLRRRYASPEAAAGAIEVDAVAVTVRTWSP